MIEIADAIGARVYDFWIEDYVTRDNFDRVLGNLQRGFERVGKMFGVVDGDRVIAEDPPSSGPDSKDQ